MLFAIITTAWLMTALYWAYRRKWENFFGVLLIVGFVWGFVCLLIIPFVGVSFVETSRVAIDNNTIQRFDLADEDNDVIVYVDPHGVKHAVTEDYFTNGEPKAAEVKSCAEPIGWITPFAWDACHTELVGNIN